MDEKLVVDASPLILLGRIDQLDLLTVRGNVVAVPRAVLAELQAGSSRDSIAGIVEAADWARIVDDEPVPSALSAWDLGCGEEQVLAFCIRRSGLEAVLDDSAARRCAASVNVPVIGTVGLVLRAKRYGAIKEVGPLIVDLRSAGLYLTDEQAARALALVGE